MKFIQGAVITSYSIHYTKLYETAVIGLTFKDFFEGLADNLLYVGLALLTTAVLLILFELKKNSEKKIDNMNAVDSVIIGIVQGIAIIPGISRSGSTIASGKLLGIEKETAANFSFLLSLPAITVITSYSIHYTKLYDFSN